MASILLKNGTVLDYRK